MGAFGTVQQARIKKTKQFFEDRDNFLMQLRKDITALVRKAKKTNMTPAIRLNGTSDIEWTRFGIMEEFPEVQFYDYTKVLNRLKQPIPKNYHITFSKSEDNEMDCRWALNLGFNVAVVFNKLPETYFARPVISGDETDVRFEDARGVIVGLTAKGKAKKDLNNFVIKVASPE
jgi:hypothetical protein